MNYSYDWVGNRLNPGSYTYNAADQLTGEGGRTYSYDDNGNLTSISGTGGKTFTYTANNLVNTVVGGSNTSTMTWDFAGNRVKLVTSGSSTYGYVYNPLAGIPAVIEEVTPSGSVYYVREPNGALLARCTSATAVANYFHFDELGSTQFITNSSALITDEYTYDPWGNVTSHTGSLSQPYQFVGQLGYYTHYSDSNVPYMQTGVRFYFPGLGRYVQRDKLRKNFGNYAYVENMPILFFDYNGINKDTYVYTKEGIEWKVCTKWAFMAFETAWYPSITIGFDRGITGSLSCPLKQPVPIPCYNRICWKVGKFAKRKLVGSMPSDKVTSTGKYKSKPFSEQTCDYFKPLNDRPITDEQSMNTIIDGSELFFWDFTEHENPFPWAF